MLYLTQRDDWHVIFTAMIWQNDLNTVLVSLVYLLMWLKCRLWALNLFRSYSFFFFYTVSLIFQRFLTGHLQYALAQYPATL